MTCTRVTPVSFEELSEQDCNGGDAMECPICGATLDHEDNFGRFCAHQDGKKIGEIYRCPNGVEQDGSCNSELFHVAGAFHVYDDEGQLKEGYPC